jgi:ankyrin repeat protein
MNKLCRLLLIAGLLLPEWSHAETFCSSFLDCITTLTPALARGAFKETPPEQQAIQYIREGDRENLQWLLKKHPELTADHYAWSLLYASADTGNPGITQALIDAGIPANTTRSGALLSSTTAAETQLLLSRGASAQEVRLSGFSPQVLDNPHARELVRIILDARPQPVANDADAAELLFNAVRHDNAKLVDFLLNRGVTADFVDTQDQYCWTALAFAENRANQAMISLLKNAGASASNPARIACQARSGKR